MTGPAPESGGAEDGRNAREGEGLIVGALANHDQADHGQREAP